MRLMPVALLTAALGAATQTPLFERVQPDLFGAGGTFLNAWADFDNDGDADQFVGFDGAPNRLYRNDDGRFRDVAREAGVADARPTRAAAWGDFDGDGDSDLLVGFAPAAAKGGETSVPAPLLKLYRNTNGTFSDIAIEMGLHVAAGAVRQLAWVDYDGDGDLDLFVAFRDRANALYRNHEGRFTDIAAVVGLADTRRTVGAVWFDHDDDGDLDVIVGNMDGDANALYSQHRGRFSDVAAQAGVEWGGRTPRDPANGTVRPCVADVDGDGRLDLYFANYGRNGLFLNQGAGRFQDVSPQWGAATEGRFDSCAFADIDNDADLDLYVNGTLTGGTQYDDHLFRNAGSRLEAITPPELDSPKSDHGVQWIDFDRDGAIDLSLTGMQKDGMHWLLRNLLPAARAARALNVRIVDTNGRARFAGATVGVHADGLPGRGYNRRLVDGGSGYNTQNDAPVHITLPEAAGEVTLTVTVPRPTGPHVVTQSKIDPARWRHRVFELRVPDPDRVVPVHQEPRHRLVFESPLTQVLDIQISPGDTTLFHTHNDPILYVTMSTSQTRNQDFGGTWSGAPAAPGAPGAPGAPDAPGAPAPGRTQPHPVAPSAPSAPSSPPGRMFSTTSYAKAPQTHRVNNFGATLFRLIGITNPSAGNEQADDISFGGMKPELSNRWFRGYRHVLDGSDTATHDHQNPVVIVLVDGRASVTVDGQRRMLDEPGRFVLVDAKTAHTLRAHTAGAQVVEVELRQP